MAHDEIDGNGVAGTVCDGPENVSKRVESDAVAVDLEGEQPLAENAAERIGSARRRQPNPLRSSAVEEDDFPLGVGLRCWPRFENNAERGDCFRPERTPAGDPGFRPRVVRSPGVQVEGGQRERGHVRIAIPAIQAE